jgi:hypothetical protein
MTHVVQPSGFDSHLHPSQVRTGSGIAFIAGLYLLIASWIHAGGTGHGINNIICGIVIAVLAALRFSGKAGTWASWINALIGIWLIISPWVYGYAAGGWKWDTIIVGIVVVVFGLWSAAAGNAGRVASA